MFLTLRGTTLVVVATLLRVVAGIGASFAETLAISLVVECSPPEKITQFFGIIEIFTGLGYFFSGAWNFFSRAWIFFLRNFHVFVFFFEDLYFFRKFSLLDSYFLWAFDTFYFPGDFFFNFTGWWRGLPWADYCTSTADFEWLFGWMPVSLCYPRPWLWCGSQVYRPNPWMAMTWFTRQT